MHDHARTAKREARRRASADGSPLQSHLDSIAREAGRRHWADFLARPVAVAGNPLDRLVREAVEDGYDGLEIEMGDHLPHEVAPILVKAFRTDGESLHLDVFRLSWDDALHLAPAVRRRFGAPNHNAAHDVDCGGIRAFLYNSMDGLLAFQIEGGRGWERVHDMDPEDAIVCAGGVVGWWRGRSGRSLAEVAADAVLHDRHVRRLATVLSSPEAPPVRHDPFCSTEVPAHPSELARAHFDAVARIVVPEGPGAAVERAVFSEIALRIRGERIPVGWGWRTAGLRDLATLARPAWDAIAAGPRSLNLTGATDGMLDEAVARIVERTARFQSGALADAVDGEGERLRHEMASRR